MKTTALWDKGGLQHSGNQLKGKELLITFKDVSCLMTNGLTSSVLAEYINDDELVQFAWRKAKVSP
jgi:hypothetical protein